MKSPPGYRFERLADGSLFRWTRELRLASGLAVHTGTAATLDAAITATWVHHRKHFTAPPAWLPVPVEEGSSP